jgi:hypothetical protein
LNAGLNIETARERFEDALTAAKEMPFEFTGRGIVIPAGGSRYFPCAFVCIKILRRLGCTLPIEIWHLGNVECDRKMSSIVEPLGVECIDALQMRKAHPARILNGWELKPYAIMHSRYKEVLLIDADNIAVKNPEFLFECEEFRNLGAVFWPDYGCLAPTRPIWEICGVAYRDEPEFESGQILVDKAKCWQALCLTMWMNEYSDFFYHYIHGDKETFHLAKYIRLRR